MKRPITLQLLWLILLTPLLLLPVYTNAQTTPPPTTLEGWVQRLEAFGSNIPQEEVFVHMDNTCYFLGDTIFYKAYVRRSDTGLPSRVSGLLYCELFNQDGYLVERQKLKLDNGQAKGSFALLDTLYGGYYELRAYTRWQLNWGEYQHPHTKNAERWFYSKKMAYEYYRDYEKLYSRVFPVYDKPQAPGEYTQDMTLRPLSRYFKKDPDHSNAVVQFFPEGGYLVAGTTGRIAFEANDEDGQHLEGELVVRNDQNEVVCTAKTKNRGRGVVTIPNVDNGKYKAEFRWGDRTVEVDVPRAVTDGCGIQVEQDGTHLIAKLSPRGTAATQSLGVTVMVDGRKVAFSETSSSDATVRFPLGDIPCGVAQVTVFDANGRIYADRLCFVRHDEDIASSQISFDSIQPTYEPFAPIHIGVRNQEGAGSTISVAVRDAAFADYTYDNGNILTEMLLGSQIRGFVEDPRYYFAANDDEHRQALDLLLMVQGWRRYSWHEMTMPGAFSINHVPEKTERLMGQVNTYTTTEQENIYSQYSDEMIRQMDAQMDAARDAEPAEGLQMEQLGASNMEEMNARFNDDQTHQGTAIRGTAEISTQRFHQNEGNLKREVLVHADFIQSDTRGALADAVTGEMMTENHGAFTIQAPAFWEDVSFLLSASDSTRWRRKQHMWTDRGETSNGEVVYPEFYVKLNPIYPRFVKPYSFYHTLQAPIPEGSVVSVDLNDGSHLMQTVTVRSKHNGLRTFDPSKPAYVIDAYEAFNQVCDAGLCPGYFIGSQRFILDVARTFIGDMNMERAYELIIRRDGKDGTYSMSDARKQVYNLLSHLHNVYIYTDYSPRREGDERFKQSDQPRVTVDLHLLEDGMVRPTWRDRRYRLYGFSVCEDFYQPDYSNKPLPTHQDYRRTLYWNPDLKLDDNGEAKILFYNNCRTTQLSISAEGLSAGGHPLTGHSNPEDR